MRVRNISERDCWQMLGKWGRGAGEFRCLSLTPSTQMMLKQKGKTQRKG